MSGISGSGKKTALRVLASENNANLIEISFNRTSDSCDLIGTYEQTDLKRKICDFIEKVKEFFLNIFNKSNEISNKELFYSWSIFHNFNNELLAIFKENNKDFYKKKKEILKEINKVLNFLKEKKADFLIEKNGKFLIENLKKYLLTFVEENLKNFEGNFEFFYSKLLENAKKGNWILIENIKEVNPAFLAKLSTVLQRKNLIINEKNNEILSIHKNFRIFLIENSEKLEEFAWKNLCLTINCNLFYSEKNYKIFAADLEILLKNKRKFYDEKLFNICLKFYDFLISKIKNQGNFSFNYDYFCKFIKICEENSQNLKQNFKNCFKILVIKNGILEEEFDEFLEKIMKENNKVMEKNSLKIFSEFFEEKICENDFSNIFGNFPVEFSFFLLEKLIKFAKKMTDKEEKMKIFYLIENFYFNIEKINISQKKYLNFEKNKIVFQDFFQDFLCKNLLKKLLKKSGKIDFISEDFSKKLKIFQENFLRNLISEKKSEKIIFYLIENFDENSFDFALNLLKNKGKN